MSTRLMLSDDGSILAELKAKPIFLQQIYEAQKYENELQAKRVQLKAEHQVPSGLLQPVMILEWKRDRVTMDFLLGLPLSLKKKDVIWVVVDRLTRVQRSGRKGKLSPRFIGPYEIIERISPVASRLALPSKLEKIHNVFHVSMLRRYRSDPSHVISPADIKIQPDMTYNEEPVRILVRKVKQLRNKCIALMKVLWQ
ncbi:receptor-like protein kinase [Gossypium australe]|uniref:Receptor-like protein kinase n=1 Tax=Gossypium australe TaxID=47621 RepID=A0A5B6X0X0_9ROSI|nr:receptor-like protein kinase [Gossypium australe]